MLRRQQERREIKVKPPSNFLQFEKRKINDARDQVAQLHH
jgi:hypothetical protein